MGRVDEAVVEIEITGAGFTIYQYALTDIASTTYTSLPTSSSSSTITGQYDNDTPEYPAYSYANENDTNNVIATPATPSSSSPPSSSSSASSSSSYYPYPYSSMPNNAWYTSIETSMAQSASAIQTGYAQNEGSSSEEESGKPKTTTTALAGVFSTIFTLGLILTIVFCCKRRRARRRLAAQDSENAAAAATSSSRPTMQQTFQSTTSGTRRSLTRDELYDVVPLPPPLARYSRIVHSSSRRSPPVLPPRNGLPPTLAQLQSHRHSTVSSSWADDSELDALATDGSTIARTISTHSVSSRISEGTVTGTSLDNPFDHPAYTFMSGQSRRTRSTPTTSSTLVSSSRTGTGTGTGIGMDILSPIHDPFSDAHTASMNQSPIESPISSISPAHLASHSRSNLDDMFGSPSVGELERGATIIQHIDGGRALPQRAALPEPDRLGDGEVHIPPTYMELYPGRNGR